MSIPLPVIANTYRCSLVWSTGIQTRNAVNVMHIQANGSGTTATDAFHALDNNVTANMWAAVYVSASVSQVNIIPLDGHTPTQSFSTGSPAKWTGLASPDLVPQVACLVKLGTGVRGRNNRGRLFLPWLGEGGISNGVVAPATVTQMQTAWLAFQAALVAMSPTEWSIVVASYDRAHGGSGAHATGITNLSIESPTATQRRRQPQRHVSRH